MYLCSVKILSSFKSNLDFLKNFKVAPKSGQRQCTIIVQCLQPNFIKNQKERIYHFYNFF